MPSFTSKYNFGIIDLGEELGSDYSVQLELDRWNLLDSLIYGMMQVFGNGVIEGWDLSASEDDKLTLLIDPGRGHINYFTTKTEYPSTITLLPETTYYIYAILDAESPTTESVRFEAYSSTIDNADYLYIGTVTTNEVAIETIDISGRQEIDFLEQIRDEIQGHKHRGGANHPSKINLQTEVVNQLPSFRIQPFDAAKISTGTVDLVRLPLISHNLLDNIGQLTHAQLESFIKSLEVTNKELMGEVASSNLMQQHILLKYLHDDPESAFYSTLGPVDKQLVNELILIPGISSSSYFDSDNSTAIIDEELREIKGIAPAQGSSFTVTYDSDLAWNEANLLDKLVIVNDTVIMSKQADETAQLVIENFETAGQDDDVISSGSVFTKEIVNLAPSDAQAVVESSSINVSEGAFSAKFSNVQSFRLQYVKQFDTAQDWSDYDSFLIDVKTNTTPHGSVRLYFVDSSGEESTHFVLLDSNEVTNSDNNDFETRIISLSSLNFVDDIKKIVIYVDDLENPFNFYIDSIVIQRAVLLPSEARMLLRHSSSASVVFNMVSWTATLPTGTNLKIRARAANSPDLLNRADFTSWLTSGELINLQGTDIEMEIIFLSDQDRINGPTLEKIVLNATSESELDGYVIDEVNELARGTTANTTITETTENKADVTLTSPVYVGSHYFILGKSAHQTYYDATTGSNASEIAIFGNNTPIAPNTVLDRLQRHGSETTVRSASLLDPKSVVRLQNRNFLIADTFNDRILEIGEDGELVNGFGSMNYSFDKLFPIAACVDERTGILYVVWSRPVPFNVIKVSKMTVKTTTTNVVLRDNYDLPSGYTSSELESLNLESQIMPIHLLDQNFAQIKELTGDIYLDIANDVVTGGIDANSVYYRSIKTFNGIPCFVGNFMYRDGIHAPTYANKTIDDGYTIANARWAVMDFSPPTGVTEKLTHNFSFADIVELDENGGLLWGSPTTWVNFSPFVPGRAQQLDKDTILIAGIKPTGTSKPVNPEGLNFTAISGDATTAQTQKDVLKNAYKDLVGTAGTIYRYKTTGWAYTSGPYVSAESVLVSDVDISSRGYLVVAETSLEKSGRIVEIDNFGNIDFSYGEGLYGLVSDLNVRSGKWIIST